MNIGLQFTTKTAEQRYGETSFASRHTAGFDLRAAIDAPMTILPGEQSLIPTGIKLDMSRASYDAEIKTTGIITPRSGRGSKEGLVLANTIGVIDQDYQGEIFVFAWARPTSGHINANNHRIGGTPVHIEPWERIAQLLFVPVFRPKITVLETFEQATERGADGFGSTGND